MTPVIESESLSSKAEEVNWISKVNPGHWEMPHYFLLTAGYPNGAGRVMSVNN